MASKETNQASGDRKVAAGVGLVAVALVAAWLLGWFGERVDPAVAELEALRSELFANGPPQGPAFDQFRAKVDALTEEQRRQFFERGMPDMRRRMSQRMDALFAQGPEALRQEAKARAADIIAMRKSGDQGGGPGGPPWGNMSEAQRDEMRKRRLDFMDPDTRAQFTEMKRMIDDELKSQGQPPMEGRDFRAMMGGRGGPPRS